jgi:hypothetical protein
VKEVALVIPPGIQKYTGMSNADYGASPSQVILEILLVSTYISSTQYQPSTVIDIQNFI